MSITRRQFLFRLGFGAVVSSRHASAQFAKTTGRSVAAVLDITDSFKARAAAIALLQSLVDRLGPGDRFLLLRLGGSFAPEQNVLVQCIMPSADASLLTPAVNLVDWHRRQARLDALWRRVEGARQSIRQFLAKPAGTSGATALFPTLAYLSHRFAREDAAEKHLFLFSDLVHDAAGVKSTLPPSQPYPYAAVAVRALCVPWSSDWDRRKTAWSSWFLGGGASTFDMVDTATAQTLPLLPPVPCPRLVSKAFS